MKIVQIASIKAVAAAVAALIRESKSPPLTNRLTGEQNHEHNVYN